MRASGAVAAVALILSVVTAAQQGGRQGGPPAGQGPYPRMQALAPQIGRAHV